MMEKFLWSVLSFYSLLINKCQLLSVSHISHTRGECGELGFCVLIQKQAKQNLPQSNSTLMTLPWTPACTPQRRHRPAHSRCTGSFLPCPSHTQSLEQTHTITSLKPQQRGTLFDNIFAYQKLTKLAEERQWCLHPFADYDLRYSRLFC